VVRSFRYSLKFAINCLEISLGFIATRLFEWSFLRGAIYKCCKDKDILLSTVGREKFIVYANDIYIGSEFIN
jgi:hypothetical protein